MMILALFYINDFHNPTFISSLFRFCFFNIGCQHGNLVRLLCISRSFGLLFLWVTWVNWIQQKPMYVLLCMGSSKGKEGYKSDVPGILIVVPWKNKPLIQTCNWYFSLYYRYNIMTIDCGFELVSICKVKSSFFSLNLVAKCFLCTLMVVAWLWRVSC